MGEILIDTDDIFDQAQQFMSHVMPETAHKVKRYRDDAPLFSRFQIEHQIETAFSRTVNLPSGGAIVIDHTEALVSVDVNSARSTRGSDIEETATRTNLEAADEIARQMRLRDLGGLIVVDFIDMEESKNRREVETRLRDALRQDRARVQFSAISKFGLLELSRQRLRPALSEGSHITCPRCNGTGHIRDTESSALQILRMVQEESMKDNTAAVHVQVPVEVTSFLLNEKRTEITKIELKQRVTVLLVPNKNLDTPNYRLERLRQDDPRLDNLQASYKMIDEPEEEVGFTRREKAKAKQEPVIKGILPETPAPVAPPKLAPIEAVPPPVPSPVAVSAPASAEGGFFAWLKRLFGAGSEQPAKPTAAPAAAVTVAPASERNDGRGERGGRGGRRGERPERGARSPGEGRDGRDGRKGRTERGPRAERPERAPTDDTAAPESAAAGRTDERPLRPEDRPEGRGEPRAERGARGPRAERDTRRPRPGPETSAEGAEPGSAAAATPVMSNPPVTGEGQGEAQAGRRRGRRGGRGGRDREESRDSEIRSAAAPLDDKASNAPGSGADAALDEAMPAALQAADERAHTAAPGDDRPDGRQRGSGRGRDRRPRRDEAQLPIEAIEPAFGSADASVARQPEVMSPVVPMAEVAPVPLPVSAVFEPAIAPAASAVQVPASAEVAATAIQSYALPLDTLQAIAVASGLEWVNSNVEKIRLVQEAMAREPQPAHVPRERKPAVTLNEGPLVLVETRKDLSQIKLPFETTETR